MRVLTDDKKDQIVKLMLNGATVGLASVAVGCGMTTIFSEFKRDAKFKQKCSEAGAICDDAVVSKLYQTAIGGNVTAMIFWLKNRQRDKWRDVYDHSLDSGDKPLNIRVIYE
jgi:hypothetical protein